MAELFIAKAPALEDYWRGIVLFGRNVASYKFALAKSLLELQPQAGTLVTLEELAPIYSRFIVEHIRNTDKQGTSPTSKFLTACKEYNNGDLTAAELSDRTVAYGFVNVIDAFHIVGQGEIPKKFFIDERKTAKGIRMTEEFSTLSTREQYRNLPQEVEARWKLVETAWKLGVGRNLLSVGYDENDEALFTVDRYKRRQSVTGSRPALNGYQKGKCFYCFCDLTIDNQANYTYPEVDHFFPHTLKQYGFKGYLDGVWNLVLACRECNRGPAGKLANLPSLRLLERLYNRNEFLITSHHPLRETLIQQTGPTEQDRRKFLNEFYQAALAMLIHEWEPCEKDRPYF